MRSYLNMFSKLPTKKCILSLGIRQATLPLYRDQRACQKMYLRIMDFLRPSLKSTANTRDDASRNKQTCPRADLGLGADRRVEEMVVGGAAVVSPFTDEGGARLRRL